MPSACRLSQTLGVYGLVLAARCETAPLFQRRLAQRRWLHISRHCLPLSSRAARPASLAVSARLAARHPSPGHGPAHQVSRLGPFTQSASSFAAFEATIEHVRTVLHESLCFGRAARLPFVWHAWSACILA